jgi:hypothetical protein
MKSITVLLLMLVSTSVLSQFMVPQTNTIRTPYGNATYTTYQQMPGFNNYGSRGPVSRKYDFYIVMKDSSNIVTRSRIAFTDSINSITVSDKSKRKINPAETAEFFRMLPNGVKFSGQPADTCWLFLCHSGKINAYSNLAEKDLMYAIAIQKGEGPIVALNATELEKMIDANDPKMAKLLKKKNFVQIIKSYNSQ